MTNQQYADDLKKLARIYETNPDIPQPYGDIMIYTWSKDIAAKVVKAFGSVDKKEYSYTKDSFYTAPKGFDISIKIHIEKDQCCTKVVVGSKEIPEVTLPAREETVIPAHTEEVYEWVCPPILAGEQE